MSWYDSKQSDGEVPVMQELWGMRSTPSLLLLRGPLWPRLFAPDKALAMGQIELNRLGKYTDIFNKWVHIYPTPTPLKRCKTRLMFKRKKRWFELKIFLLLYWLHKQDPRTQSAFNFIHSCWENKWMHAFSKVLARITTQITRSVGSQILFPTTKTVWFGLVSLF